MHDKEVGRGDQRSHQRRWNFSQPEQRHPCCRHWYSIFQKVQELIQENLTSLLSFQWLKNLAGWSGRWDRRLTASQSSHMRIVARHPYLTCSGQEISQSLVFHHTPPLGKMLMNMSNLEAASQYCTTVCTLTVSSMITSH